MNKINIRALMTEVYSDMAILPIPFIEKLVSIGKTMTADEALLALVKSTLLEFERYYPYKTTLKLPNTTCGKIEVGDSWTNQYFESGNDSVIKFYDNSEQVFYNLIDEFDLQLIPLAVKRCKINRTTSHPTDFRAFEYQQPYLFGVPKNTYKYYSGLFKYPVIVDMKDTNVVNLSKSWILLMPYGNDTYRTFRRALTINIIDEILALKENAEIPGLPINVFGGLNRIRERFDRLVQTEYSQAAVSWGWD